jgi:hypothetical protein
MPPGRGGLETRTPSTSPLWKPCLPAKNAIALEWECPTGGKCSRPDPCRHTTMTVDSRRRGEPPFLCPEAVPSNRIAESRHCPSPSKNPNRAAVIGPGKAGPPLRGKDAALEPFRGPGELAEPHHANPVRYPRKSGTAPSPPPESKSRSDNRSWHPTGGKCSRRPVP